MEPISEAGDWTSLAYWVALNVGVNPINGNLLLRGPLGVPGGMMGDDPRVPVVDEQQLAKPRRINLQSIFVPHAKRQRDEAYAKLEGAGRC